MAVAFVKPAGKIAHVPIIRAQADQPIRQAGKIPFHDLQPLRQDGVGVAALRHTFAVLSRCREGVPFQQCHLLKMVGQHAGGQKPTHAGPDDHCLLAGKRF